MSLFFNKSCTVFFIVYVWINLILRAIDGAGQTQLQTRSPEKCSIFQFTCTSGQSCIDSSLLCDGFRDCPDSSDETAQQCSNRNCLSDEFRCTYGACISISAKCDGRTDCADNSDETNADCPLIVNEIFSTGRCNSNQFQCMTSKNCIDKRLTCDGKGDCADNSDETARQCGRNMCPSSKFRCEYGACVSASARCNRKKDCIDGSDEFQRTCSPDNTATVSFAFAIIPSKPGATTAAPPTTCMLPDNSYNIQLTINCPKETPKCADMKSKKVKWNTEVKYRCKDGYATHRGNTSFESVCWKGHWVPPKFHTCKRTCQQLKPENVELTCMYKGSRDACKGKMVEGTSVRPRCWAHYRETQPIHYRQIHCESNGKWTDELFKCVPDCGKPIRNVETLISNASPEKYGEAPWYVAIYDVKDSKYRTLICGGTLISPYLIVSAAHCFFDESTQKLNNAKDYEIVVGKFSRQYSKRDNRFTKFYKIREIFLPSKAYTGFSTRYASDIAILWVTEKISINRAVLPACVPWTEGKQFNPGDGSLGKLTGFGKTENDTGSEFLLTAQLPFISRDKCIKSLHDDFKDIVTLDKFCAGSVKGSGAQKGDSGGGLLFRDADLGVYYLQGIVSVKDDSSSSVAVFTSVTSYLDWMDQVRIHVQKFNPNSSFRTFNPAPQTTRRRQRPRNRFRNGPRRRTFQ